MPLPIVTITPAGLVLPLVELMAYLLAHHEREAQLGMDQAWHAYGRRLSWN